MPEHIIYSANPSEFIPKYIKSKFKMRLSEFLLEVSKVMVFFGIVLLVISFAPSVWYFVKSAEIEKISQILARPIS